MDAAFRLVDEHPQGAIIAHSDTEHLMQRHIKHKDGKFHLWCREVDEALKKITPEKEAKALQSAKNVMTSSQTAWFSVSDVENHF